MTAREYKATFNFGNFTSTTEDPEVAERLQKVQNLCHVHGFKVLGESANEALFMTGCWRESEHFVFCISDATPYYDEANEHIVHPDPFNMPEDTNSEVAITVYKKPFAPNPDTGDSWVMDGSAPTMVNDQDIELFTVHSLSLREAITFCDTMDRLVK